MKFQLTFSFQKIKGSYKDFFFPLYPVVFLAPFYFLFYFLVWQGLETARLKRLIHEKNTEKEELVRKNDELKIGIVSYTSAERIEALYRKTYQYLPISLGNRIITIELPREPNLKDTIH
ncbi:hypothetical protein [Leptospira sp. 'Mane']|uniref:hypothetical protein n=1 Tax=Leptospira sp. 'Mane' TaxID=3387407 RepID=UPI00398ABBC6